MQSYIPRFITEGINQKLENIPAVLILGPRQCGKSTLARAIISEMTNAMMRNTTR